MGESTIQTLFEGKVAVVFVTKKHEHVMTVVRDIKNILKKKEGFKIDDASCNGQWRNNIFLQHSATDKLKWR
ncbi:hypothetical protein ACOMHN_021279 [Nucella lapillus]